MKTVFDYIEYYGNLTFDECSFNDMDNIIFSVLSYLPLDGVLGNGSMGITEVNNLISNKNVKLPINNLSLKILGMLAERKRYESVVFANYADVLDDITQFCALTIRFGKRNCYVAFRGTDNSLTGWKENLELSYKYPVKAQLLASEYLKNTIKFSDRVIYVGGHSKGGNLAMASVMETTNSIYNRIKYVYNNDGPGFLKKQFSSPKFKLMEKKLRMFMPEDSVVGILLYNSDNFHVVKSTEFGVKQHYPTSWACFGQFLIEGELSKNSLRIKNQLNSWAESTSKEEKKLLADTFFEVISQSDIKYFYQIRDLKLSQFTLMVNETRNIDENSKKMLINTLKALIFDKDDKRNLSLSSMLDHAMLGVNKKENH